MTWNTNELLQYKENIIVTLVDQKIDVCLISETHITRESCIKLQGFGVYHTTHPNNCARGGSAVIIKEEISHHEDIKKEEFQVTSVKIKTTSGTITTVAAMYSPPRYNLQIEGYLNLLESFSGKFIIGEDFNSKNTHWGSRLSNTKGSELYHAIKRHNC
jgi:hypothetical protein